MAILKKAVLMSIQPHWCDLIFNGSKTIEVRKTIPKAIKMPFKVFVYCSKPVQKVIGEFTVDKIGIIDCDSVAPFERDERDPAKYVDNECKLNREMFLKYSGFRCCYGWHILNVKKYCIPILLEDMPFFKIPSRAPQSWQYIFEV